MNVLRLIPEAGGAPIPVTQDRVRIGRDADCEIHIKDASVSRQHAEIQRNDDEWVIVDSNSGNGVLIDGERANNVVLLPGQRLQFGTVFFRVEIDRDEEGSTVILSRSPLARSSTMAFKTPPIEPKAPTPADNLRVATMAAGGLAVLAVGLVATYFWYRTRPVPAPVRAASPAPISVPRATPTPTPEPTPTPTPTPPPPPPRAFLLISTEAPINVFVDGNRVGAFAAGALRRLAVSPGEHIVSFRSGDVRQDQVVRAGANEQAVARFSPNAAGASPRTLPDPLPSPSPRPTSPPGL